MGGIVNQSSPQPVTQVYSEQQKNYVQSQRVINPKMSLDDILKLDSTTLTEMLKVTYERQQLTPMLRYVARGLDILLGFVFVLAGDFGIVVGLALIAWSVYRLVKPKAEKNNFYNDIDKAVAGIENYKKYLAGEIQIQKEISQKDMEKVSKNIGKFIPKLLKVFQRERIMALIPIINGYGDETSYSNLHMAKLINGDLYSGTGGYGGH